MASQKDREILRDLVKQYKDCCERPGQQELRKLWKAHNSLKPTRPLVTVMAGGNAGEKEFKNMEKLCEDLEFRTIEQSLRRFLWVATLNDDTIFEPWIGVGAERILPPDSVWGIKPGFAQSAEGGKNMFHDVPIKTREDMKKMIKPAHKIDEEKTKARFEYIRDAVGDILPVVVNRASVFSGWRADISTDITQFLGMEQLMIMMYEDPDWLREILTFMRDGILAGQDQADAAGDMSYFNGNNQSMPYSEELPDPSQKGGAKRSQLWGYFAAQEFTLISPEMHEEFMLNYQLPIIKPYGLTAYGCCEDLTKKIDMLRKVPNLRRIAVTPVADVGKCAEQIKKDYVLSWRPNPAHISCGFDEARIRGIIAEGLKKSKNCFVDITLKDITTVENQPERIPRWVQIVREEIDKFMGN